MSGGCDVDRSSPPPSIFAGTAVGGGRRRRAVEGLIGVSITSALPLGTALVGRTGLLLLVEYLASLMEHSSVGRRPHLA